MSKKSSRSNQVGLAQGELQAQIMPVIWRIERGTVEQIRSGLPKRYQSAYTTVQTVLNRLVERGLLKKEKSGTAMVYSACISEEQYFSNSVENTLASASTKTKQAVLAQLLGSLSRSELLAIREQLDRPKKGKK